MYVKQYYRQYDIAIVGRFIIIIDSSVHCWLTGAYGDDLGVVMTLQMLDDSEEEKYYMPIVISDSGNPPNSGTSTLTISVTHNYGDYDY